MSLRMQVFINGQARPVPDGCTLDDLLALHEVQPSRVVVEINRAIVPKAAYGALRINAGDSVEILRFVGGG